MKYVLLSDSLKAGHIDEVLTGLMMFLIILNLHIATRHNRKIRSYYTGQNPNPVAYVTFTSFPLRNSNSKIPPVIILRC